MGDRLLQLAAGLEHDERVKLRLRAGCHGKAAVSLTSTWQHPGLEELAGWVFGSADEIQGSQLEASPMPERIGELVGPARRPETALADLMDDKPCGQGAGYAPALARARRRDGAAQGAARDIRRGAAAARPGARP